MPSGIRVEEERVGNPLTTSREPVGPKRAGDKGSVADTAVMDAVYIIIGCLVILFFLGISLRRHNV